MSGFVQVQIEPEAIIEAMNEDGSFALEVWREIAEKLHMGLLLDNCMDVVKGSFSKDELVAFKGSLDLMSESIGDHIDSLKYFEAAAVRVNDDEDEDFIATKTPQECHFGIIDNYEGFTNDTEIGVFISFVEDGDCAYDNMHNGLLTRVPDWLPKSTDCECHWSVPKSVTKEQVMKDMTELGYTHMPEWDGDYA